MNELVYYFLLGLVIGLIFGIVSVFSVCVLSYWLDKRKSQKEIKK